VRVKSQVSFPVCYKGQYLGEYVADLVVEDKVIVELKCVDRFANEHLAQCINYLKASGLRVALLINFQKPKVEWKRVILDQQLSHRRTQMHTDSFICVHQRPSVAEKMRCMPGPVPPSVTAWHRSECNQINQLRVEDRLHTGGAV
jgi:hypothetical protein